MWLSVEVTQAGPQYTPVHPQCANTGRWRPDRAGAGSSRAARGWAEDQDMADTEQTPVRHGPLPGVMHQVIEEAGCLPVVPPKSWLYASWGLPASPSLP